MDDYHRRVSGRPVVLLSFVLKGSVCAHPQKLEK